LEDFAVQARYAHDFLQPNLDETQELYAIAKAVEAVVLKRWNGRCAKKYSLKRGKFAK